MKIHIYHHYEQSSGRGIEHKLQALLLRVEAMMATLDDLITKVTNIGTVEDSVIALLNDISARLKAAGQDQAKLDALASSIDAQTTKLSDAVVANTPAA